MAQGKKQSITVSGDATGVVQVAGAMNAVNMSVSATQADANQSRLHRRRAVPGLVAAWLIFCARSTAALPLGVEGRSVRIQLDQGALQTIPGDERADVKVAEDKSAKAQALIKETPHEKAIPVIYLVIGVLSIPVIWDTVQEMLRREYYGGVIIDARQTPALITHDKSLSARFVLFISADGKSEKYEAKDFSENVLEKLGPSLLKKR